MRPIGLSARLSIETGEVLLMFVDPDHAERGIGHMRLSAHDALHAAGCKDASYLPTSIERALSVRASAELSPRRVESRVRLPQPERPGAPLRSGGSRCPRTDFGRLRESSEASVCWAVAETTAVGVKAEVRPGRTPRARTFQD